MSAEELTSRLDKVFENVNGWLRFAEAKNAALLTFDAAAIFGLSKTYVDYKTVAPNWACWIFAGATVFLSLSLLLCLASFIARTKVPKFMIVHASCAADMNLMFYGHIAQMLASEYVRALAVSIGFDEPATKHHSDMASQIVINSKIALNKYSLFNAGLWLTVSAIITPIGALIFYFYMDYRNETI